MLIGVFTYFYTTRINKSENETANQTPLIKNETLIVESIPLIKNQTQLLKNQDGTYNLSIGDIQRIKLKYDLSGSFGNSENLFLEIDYKDGQYITKKGSIVNNSLINNLMKSLAGLRSSEGIEHCSDKPENDPQVLMEILNKEGNKLFIFSTLPCNGFLPWSVIMSNKIYSQHSGKISKALLEILNSTGNVDSHMELYYLLQSGELSINPQVSKVEDLELSTFLTHTGLIEFLVYDWHLDLNKTSFYTTLVQESEFSSYEWENFSIKSSWLNVNNKNYSCSFETSGPSTHINCDLKGLNPNSKSISEGILYVTYELDGFNYTTEGVFK